MVFSVFCVFFHMKNVSSSSNVNGVKQVNTRSRSKWWFHNSSVGLRTADPQLRFVEFGFIANIFAGHSAAFLFFAIQLPETKAKLQKLKLPPPRPEAIIHLLCWLIRQVYQAETLKLPISCMKKKKQGCVCLCGLLSWFNENSVFTRTIFGASASRPARPGPRPRRSFWLLCEFEL